MKKKKLKHLSLKKRTISNLNRNYSSKTNEVVGGITPATVWITAIFSCSICEADNTIIDDTVGQSMDCTSGCDETFTCRDWSCDCF